MAFFATALLQLTCFLLCLRPGAQECVGAKQKYICDAFDWPSDAKSVTINISDTSKHQSFEPSELAFSETLYTLIIHNSINNLPKGSLKSFKKLDYISATSNDLQLIKTGVFENPYLLILDLSDNKIRTVEKGAFDSTPKLIKLQLSHNNLKKIQPGLFNNTNLQSLYLDHNQVSAIQATSFGGMSKLLLLRLNNNRLKSFFAIEAFNCTTCSLYSLYLQHNYLTEISREMLEGLQELILLCLSNNLISYIEPEVFVQTPRLNVLNLEYNLLTSLESNAFPSRSLTSLKQLYIGHNKLTFLSTNLIIRLPQLLLVRVGGNPWQCSCLDQVLRWFVDINATSVGDNDYFRGKRPVCVSTGTHLCEYSYNEAHYWTFNYYNNKYPQEDICNITSCN